jgi:hypothetical protein
MFTRRYRGWRWCLLELLPIGGTARMALWQWLKKGTPAATKRASQS